MKKRFFATILVLVLVFSFASSAMAYSSRTVPINFKSYKDTEGRYTPYTGYSSSQMLYFTVTAQVYPTKQSTIPCADADDAQLLQIRAEGQSIKPMQRKLVWNGDSTNYSSLTANTYYRIRFGNYDGENYIKGNVEIRYGSYQAD
ncbi:hypothetical protein SDC9_118212 [bioreactor metagenome]|uniref:Uncharacterized protein n=1 Tax=bioreactor metagenome TaxID=1076179 RepID=A0A645C0U3_9ZZZZ